MKNYSDGDHNVMHAMMRNNDFFPVAFVSWEGSAKWQSAVEWFFRFFRFFSDWVGVGRAGEGGSASLEFMQFLICSTRSLISILVP